MQTTTRCFFTLAWSVPVYLFLPTTLIPAPVNNAGISNSILQYKAGQKPYLNNNIFNKALALLDLYQIYLIYLFLFIIHTLWYLLVVSLRLNPWLTLHCPTIPLLPTLVLQPHSNSFNWLTTLTTRQSKKRLSSRPEHWPVPSPFPHSLDIYLS